MNTKKNFAAKLAIKIIDAEQRFMQAFRSDLKKCGISEARIEITITSYQKSNSVVQ